MTKAIRGDVKVTLEHIDEGYDGEFDPDDTEDEPLLRFTIFVKDALRTKYAELGELSDPDLEASWADISNGCWCCQVSDNLSDAEKAVAAEMILDLVYDAVVATQGVKRATGEATCLNSGEVKAKMAAVKGA
jgi:hypothetical protein